MSKNSSKVIALVILIIAIGGGYMVYKKNTQTAPPYVEEQSEKTQDTKPAADNSQAVPSSVPTTPTITVNTPGVTVVAEPVKKPVSVPVAAPTPSVLTITFDDNGFSPNLPTVKAGTKVTFKNNSSHPFWPASGIHPTHEAYPGSSITKCGTADAATIFDACAPVAAGGTWSFIFNAKGSWPFHDHLDPSKWGKISVE